MQVSSKEHAALPTNSDAYSFFSFKSMNIPTAGGEGGKGVEMGPSRTYMTAKLLTLSYSSKINAMLCPQRGFSALEKTQWFALRGHAAHPFRCDSPLQIVMAIWSTFLNLNLLGRVWEPAVDYEGCWARFIFLKKSAKRPLFLQQAVTPDKVTQQNSLQRAGGPKMQLRHFEAWFLVQYLT